MTLVLLDYASVLIFALTGALAASRAQLDLIGFGFIACLTALGGGTLRDVFLDRPVFWIENPTVLAICWRPHWSFSLPPRLWKAVTHG